MISVPTYKDERSTSVALTPKLRHWLFSRAQYNDRSVQVEMLTLVTWALNQIMERDLAALAEILAAGPAPQTPG